MLAWSLLSKKGRFQQPSKNPCSNSTLFTKVNQARPTVLKRLETTEVPTANIKDEMTLTPQGDGSYRVNFVQSVFKTHKCSGPNNFSTTTKEELFKFFKQMSTIRRIEITADNLYKARLIRGFLHLYNGQEAIVTGYEANMTKADHIITAYRDHGHMYGRGGTPYEIIAELLGKYDGCSHGKGGSMHMYKADANYWGGNGIVGAQCPIGAGLAFGAKYNKTGGVALTFYGDGAANQGQLFEAFNMAALWKLPCLFVCENNKYGMGTSVERSSADTNYFSRGDFVPGLKINANNVFAVKEGVRYAMDYARKTGPMVLEMETYRYYGHSMSDPGISYRAREEVQLYKQTRDPIDKVKNLMLTYKLAKEEELTEIEKEIRKEVEAAAEKAKAAPVPEPKELYTDVYAKTSGPYYVRTVDLPDSVVVKND